MLFYGNWDYLLDDRNRIPIPPDFREEFNGGAFLVLGVEPCIQMYTHEGWTEQAKLLQSFGTSAEEARNAHRAFASNTHRATKDGQGRVVIPEQLISLLGLPKEVTVIGAMACLEVWSRQDYLAMQNQLRATQRDLLNRRASVESPGLYPGKEG